MYYPNKYLVYNSKLTKKKYQNCHILDSNFNNPKISKLLYPGFKFTDSISNI